MSCSYVAPLGPEPEPPAEPAPAPGGRPEVMVQVQTPRSYYKQFGTFLELDEKHAVREVSDLPPHLQLQHAASFAGDDRMAHVDREGLAEELQEAMEHQHEGGDEAGASGEPAAHEEMHRTATALF